MPTIVLATGNPHKVRELREIFASMDVAGVEVLGLGDLRVTRPLEEPEECGTTFEENARIKALSYATQIGEMRASRDQGIEASSVWCLGDDSGIEIDALRLADGTARPGVISSHYSSDGVEMGIGRAERDAANNARVLRELDGVPAEKRAARFVCCMCLARAEEPGESFRKAILHETRGVCEGRIGVPPRVPAGANGFGYDPLFLVAQEFARTGAELPAEEKNRISHRGMAGRLMAEWLRRRVG
jgi:XTP/dITP diphosphohydrolase